MNRPSPLRPLAKLAIVQQSRDDWKSEAGALSQALDATSFVMLHGDRPQQIAVANAARGLLQLKGYPVRPVQTMRFDVTVRTANGFQAWTAIGLSSFDVLCDTLNHFDEQTVTVRVRREA